MESDLNNTSFFSRRDGFPEKILLFIGIDVHKSKWVVTIRTYDLELKTFSMKPSAEELERSLLKNYPGADYRIVYDPPRRTAFRVSGFTITSLKRDTK